MTRLFLLLIFSIATNLCESQETKNKGDRLIQLNKPKTVLDNYLNFDVPKIMIGQGIASGVNATNHSNLSIKGQFLWPYAISKRYLKIAYGLTFGSSKISLSNTELKIQNSRLSAIESNKDIKTTMIRTGYIGVAAYRVIRLRSVTLLAGPSIEYNLFCKVKERKNSGVSRFSGRNFINDISVPLNLQISFSKRQFFAFGIFGSYDITPRFKGNEFESIKQVVIGLSGSVIL